MIGETVRSTSRKYLRSPTLPHLYKWPSTLTTLLLFADDTKCFRPVRCYTNTCLLQQDLNNWSNDWKISFNESKWTLLRFCSSPQTTYQSNYTINHQQLSPTDSHTNLGIVMSADLSWRKHYLSCAYRTLGLLRRTFNTTNSVNLKKLLYLSLVCSQLTYCSIIWHPYLHKNILMLEMIQWRATKFILNDYSSDYKSRFTPTAPSDALWAHWHHFLC